MTRRTRIMALLSSTITSVLPSVAQCHVLVYGALLGTQLYQSFVMTKLCFKHLPMSSFTSLQRKVFPVYFACQCGATLVTAATYPNGGLIGLAGAGMDAVALGVLVLTAGLNGVVYGPRTSQAMIARIHQGEIGRLPHEQVELVLVTDVVSGQKLRMASASTPSIRANR